MSLLTITKADFKSCGWNALCGDAHLFSGSLTANVVSIAAHRLFKVKKKSYQSYAIKVCALFAGTAASFYLRPYTALQKPLPMRKSLELFVLIDLPFMLFNGIPIFAFHARVSEWLGQRNLVVLGAIGAAAVFRY